MDDAPTGGPFANAELKRDEVLLPADDCGSAPYPSVIPPNGGGSSNRGTTPVREDVVLGGGGGTESSETGVTDGTRLYGFGKLDPGGGPPAPAECTLN